MMLRRWKIGIMAFVICGASLLAGLVRAQADDMPWLPPANLSNSGAATQPVIAVTADGGLHALWWDAALGALYSRAAIASDATWSTPTRVPEIVGRRVLDTQTGVETITAPREMRLVADAANNVYAFWYNSDDQLLSAVNRGGGWSEPFALAEKAVQFEAAPGPGDRLHLIYIRPIDSEEAPAGVYYRSAIGGNWDPARRIDVSAYYRTIRPEQAHLSVAGNEAGSVIATWDQPPLNQSQFARSIDQGATWSEPQPVISAEAGQARRARVAPVPNGEFLLQWQDPAASGCGFTQYRSSDNGETWTTPEVVLSALTRCDMRWTFAPDQAGRLWLIGQPAGAAANVVTVAAWNGAAWSEPRDVTFAFFDDRTQLTTNLNCVNLSIAGATAGIIGCDARSDVWAARNASDLDQWLSGLTSVWSQPQAITSQSGTVALEALPDTAVDSAGHVYATWNQLASDGSGSELFTAVWREGRWSGASRFSTTETAGADAAATAARQARQPALIADNRDRVHVVWSGGSAGEIYYSWAYARDLGGGQRWNEAAQLSPASALAHWPDIAADPRGTTLYVIYTLPFNEQRGVYLSVSPDNGQSWQAPLKVFDAAAAGWASVDRARLAFDPERKILHAVWQRRALPGQNQPEEIYYAASRDDGRTWSTPRQAASGVVAWPQVIVPAAGQVYLAWCQTEANASNVRGQFSPDEGQRWSAAAPIYQFDQVSCPVSLATDALGQMQVASTAANSGGESILLTTVWNGQTWNRPEVHALGQRASADNAVSIALVPQVDRLSAVIKLWSQTAAAGSGFEIVVTDRQIPAVGVLQPAPTFTPLPTVTPGPTTTPSPTETPRAQPDDRALRPPTSGGGPPPMILGGALAAIIVVIVVVRVIWVKRR